MNRAILYLYIVFLGLVSLNSKANDPRYSKPDINPADPLSQLPPALKGRINHYIDPKDNLSFMETNRSNYQAVVTHEFSPAANLNVEEWHREFVLSKPSGKTDLINYLAWTENNKIFVSVKIVMPKGSLAEILPHCSYVQSLNLEYSILTEQDLQVLENWLKSSTVLKNLKVLLPISPREALSFVEMVTAHTSLESLQISIYPIKPDQGLRFHSDFLKASKNTLKELSILTPIGITEECQTLATILKTNPSIKDLSVYLESVQAVSPLAEVLKNHPSLERLFISGSGMDDAGVYILTDALTFNKSLIHLNLRANLGTNGIQNVARMLASNSTLKSLHLYGSDNPMDNLMLLKPNGPEIGQALAEALKTNQTLQVLDLAYSGIGNAGVQAIAEALTINNSLKTLNLSSNYRSDEGVYALAEALKINQSLTLLNLSHNPNITEEGAWALFGARNLRDPTGLKPRLEILLKK